MEKNGMLIRTLANPAGSFHLKWIRNLTGRKLSTEATDYVNYLIGSGIKAESLKKVIQEIRNIDKKFQTRSRSEIIKEAFSIAEQRAKAWYQKYGLKPDQLSEDELLETMNKMRDGD